MKRNSPKSMSCTTISGPKTSRGRALEGSVSSYRVTINSMIVELVITMKIPKLCS